MRQAAKEAGMNYETLKFYCKEGLIPNVKRDENNYRIFSNDNIIWLRSLQCFKQLGMSIKELKHFMNLCMQGKETIPVRKEILSIQKNALLERIVFVLMYKHFIKLVKRASWVRFIMVKPMR